MSICHSPETTEASWTFDNSYTRLPKVFYTRLNPTPVFSPGVVIFNHALASSLGLNFESFSDEVLASLFSGNSLPNGSEPLAQAYAGHQFGHFNILGDGRAILIGEHLTPKGERFDVQLKGSGPTPYSRRGDGRAALGPMLREYIISEAMAALRIPTTRSLAVVTSGEDIQREELLPGAVLTRIARSHIRVGTFEYITRYGGENDLEALTTYAIKRHYPELSEDENPPLAFLKAVMASQAKLIAQWMSVGFIHGVMNTDNMAISGETIDYGPCAFMDTYDPQTVFSSIDRSGRYAYENQPIIAQWNLARFAETLLPLLHTEPAHAIDAAKEAIEAFPNLYEDHWLSMMGQKIGLFNATEDDRALIQDLLKWMRQHKADMTATFSDLSNKSLTLELFKEADFAPWFERWQSRLAEQSQSKEARLALMRSRNPVVIPRNYRVEEALAAACQESPDFTVVHALLNAVTNPYDTSLCDTKYATPPVPITEIYQTFCGT